MAKDVPQINRPLRKAAALFFRGKPPESNAHIDGVYTQRFNRARAEGVALYFGPVIRPSLSIEMGGIGQSQKKVSEEGLLVDKGGKGMKLGRRPCILSENFVINP